MRSSQILGLLAAAALAAPAGATPCDHVDYVISCGQTISVVMPSPTSVMDDYPPFAVDYLGGEYVLEFTVPPGQGDLALHHVSQEDHAVGLMWTGACDSSNLGWWNDVPIGTITANLTPGDTHHIVIDGDGTVPPGYCVHVTPQCDGAPFEICTGGADEDGDGLADLDDPDCSLYGCGGAENCLNGVDDDGDGLVDCQDPDCSLFPACTESDCGNYLDDDQDGLIDCADPDCFGDPTCNTPGETDCANNLDDDLDGAVDCLDLDCCTDQSCCGSPTCVGLWPDDDGDGSDVCEDCDDGDPTLEALDIDGDGYSTCEGDCDDGFPSIHPGAPEHCDGLDSDCDGAIPLAELDGDGDGVPPCMGDCNDYDLDVGPDGVEVCNGRDDDCDSLIDEGFDEDADGWSTCEGDCHDGDTGVYPGAEEICDQLDNDCDGLVDEPFDADGDGFTSCGMDADCNDMDPTVFPGADEVCNGRDDDCDGYADESVFDCPPDPDGEGGDELDEGYAHGAAGGGGCWCDAGHAGTGRTAAVTLLLLALAGPLAGRRLRVGRRARSSGLRAAPVGRWSAG